MDSLAIVTDGLSQSGGGYNVPYIVTWGLVSPVTIIVKRLTWDFIPDCVPNKIGGNLGTYTYVDWSGM